MLFFVVFLFHNGFEETVSRDISIDAPHVYSKLQYLPVTYAVLIVGAIMLLLLFSFWTSINVIRLASYSSSVLVELE